MWQCIWSWADGNCGTATTSCVCGLLANGEPESNLIKTFPVNIKHITDIHATQDLQWPASALCTPHRLRCVHVRLTWNINLLAPVSVCKYSPHPDPPIRAEHNAPIRSHCMATFSWFLFFDFVTAWVSTVNCALVFNRCHFDFIAVPSFFLHWSSQWFMYEWLGSKHTDCRVQWAIVECNLTSIPARHDIVIIKS